MICNFIEEAWKLLLDFLDANATQTLILIVTILITWYIFYKQNKQREQEAATMVLLELKSFNITIKENKEHLNNDGTFDIHEMWRAVKVCNNNSWESCRQILFKYLSMEEICTINNYYKCINIIDEQIETFHKIIYATYESFYIEHKMKSYDEIKDDHPHIRTFSNNLSILQNHYEKATTLFDALPISKLEKISRK